MNKERSSKIVIDPGKNRVDDASMTLNSEKKLLELDLEPDEYYFSSLPGATLTTKTNSLAKPISSNISAVSVWFTIDETRVNVVFTPNIYKSGIDLETLDNLHQCFDISNKPDNEQTTCFWKVLDQEKTQIQLLSEERVLNLELIDTSKKSEDPLKLKLHQIERLYHQFQK